MNRINRDTEIGQVHREFAGAPPVEAYEGRDRVLGYAEMPAPNDPAMGLRKRPAAMLPITIGPIGSRGSHLICYFAAPEIGAPLVGGPWVQTGCFIGTLDDFAQAVEAHHGGNEYGQAYRAAIAFLRALAAAQPS